MIVVDNVFATPILQKPLTYGADIVVYSGTKHIDGQGRVLGGAILSTRKFKEELLQAVSAPHRPVDFAFQCVGAAERSRDPQIACPASKPGGGWPLLRRSGDVAGRDASHLSASRQPSAGGAVRGRRWSAGGTMVTFEVTGGKARAFDVLRRLELIDISNNLGDAKSLITHPASTTHRNIGAGSARADGHYRRHAATVGGPRGYGRSPGRSQSGDRGFLSPGLPYFVLQQFSAWPEVCFLGRKAFKATAKPLGSGPPHLLDHGAAGPGRHEWPPRTGDTRAGTLSQPRLEPTSQRVERCVGEAG